TALSSQLRFDDWLEAMPEPDLTKGVSPKIDPVPVAVTPDASSPEATVNAPALAPHPSGSLSDAQRRQLAEEIRGTIFRSADTRSALHRLQTALAPTNARRHINAENVIRVCSVDGPMAALVRAL